MKHVLAKFSVTALVTLASISLPAQTRTLVYGRTTVQFNSSFMQTLTGLGAVVTDLNQNSLKNGAVTFVVKEGSIDLQNAAGEVTHSGGYMISAGGAVLRIQNLVLDTTNGNAPVITGLYVVNDKLVGRLPIFSVQPPAGITLPLTPQTGIEQINGFGLTLAPAAATAINGVFGAQVLQAGTGIGTADVYTVLAVPGTDE
jgi:hypothetical protein